MIVGAAKCGTSSLASYLAAHPEIFMCRPKEPNFFSYRWAKGLDWYQRLFAGSDGYRAVGEASVSYSMAPEVLDVPRRIASVVPNVRLLYVIRHPIDRIRSHYRFRVFRGKETAPTVAEAVARYPGYVRISSYAYQLEQYLDHFDASRILVVPSERLRTNRRRMLEEILEFLGVDAGIVPSNLESELNRGEERGRAPSWLEKPREVWRSMAWVTGRVPRRWRKRLRWSVTYRSFSPEALEIPPQVQESLLQELRPDLERLRMIVGPKFDLWGLA